MHYTTTLKQHTEYRDMTLINPDIGEAKLVSISKPSTLVKLKC